MQEDIPKIYYESNLLKYKHKDNIIIYILDLLKINNIKNILYDNEKKINDNKMTEKINEWGMRSIWRRYFSRNKYLFGS